MAYRLALAEGFLAEAEQDVGLERWRSCVDNAQLAIENAGKAVLALFGVAPRTHDPAQQVAAVLRTQVLPAEIQEALRRTLPDLLALGSAEHFLAYEVEFTNELGETCAFLALRPDQFIVVWRAKTRTWLSISEQVATLVAHLPEEMGREVLDFACFLRVREQRRQAESLTDPPTKVRDRSA